MAEKKNVPDWVRENSERRAGVKASRAASKTAKNVAKRGGSEAEAKKTAEKFAKNVKGKGK